MKIFDRLTRINMETMNQLFEDLSTFNRWMLVVIRSVNVAGENCTVIFWYDFIIQIMIYTVSM